MSDIVPIPREAADEIERLRAALRWYIKHVEYCEGTDFLSASYPTGPEDEPHASIVRAFRTVQY